MQSPFIAAINALCAEKNLPRETVLETIKAALRAAYRKDYGTREQNIDVALSEENGTVTVYLVKQVAKKVFDTDLEISKKDAGKYVKGAKVGDEIRIDVTPVGYGRIAAQSAKQVIIQRLQEAERDMMYEIFKDRENELLNALVHRVENQNVYIDLDKITTVLPREQQIPGERYYGGQRLKIYLDKVIKTTKGPQLLISRTHPGLVRKLLELEIPEVKAALVELKAIAREPGTRCKIAVSSNDPKVDPIGACVGQKGVRVQNIMDELNGERIDVIAWHDDPQRFIRASLAPAKIVYIRLATDVKRAGVYVATDQRPLAIGKQGQNVRLASKLTGYEIDIMDVAELDPKELEAAKKTGEATGVPSERPVEKEEVMLISALDGVPESVVKALEGVNLTQVEQLKGLSAKDYLSIDGIEAEGAAALIAALKKVK